MFIQENQSESIVYKWRPFCFGLGVLMFSFNFVTDGHQPLFTLFALLHYLLYYITGDYHLWPIVYYLTCTRASACVPHGMGSNQSSFLLKMVLSKGAFYPLSFFVCTLMNCWIASSLRVSDAIWVIYRMHVLDTLTMSTYLRHLSVLFRTRWLFAKILPKNIMSYSMRKKFLYAYRGGWNGTA